MSKAYIHIGTHKTGSTALQFALWAHREALADLGYCYPAAGISPGTWGHHNLAWELSGDARFQSELGTVTDALNELTSTKVGAIFSSEDFECTVYNNMAGFSKFLEALRDRQFEVVVCVYLRNQPDYIRSLYIELLKHGLCQPFDHFVGSALSGHGVIRWKQWAFPLCYRDFLRRIEAIHPGEIRVRSYDAARNSIVDDFFPMLDLQPALLGIDNELRMNERLPLPESFSLFCKNLGLSAFDTSAALLEVLAGGKVPPLSLRCQSEILKRFDHSNKELAKTYGLEIPVLVDKGPTIKNGLWFDDIFSEELVKKLRHPG